MLEVTPRQILYRMQFLKEKEWDSISYKNTIMVYYFNQDVYTLTLSHSIFGRKYVEIFMVRERELADTIEEIMQRLASVNLGYYLKIFFTPSQTIDQAFPEDENEEKA